jgi:hypothetical protein
MFAANTYVIRRVEVVERLAELDSQRPLAGPALLGEIDGRPAAAISLEDGRVVADPFQPTANLITLLRMRASGLRAHERTPALRDRLRAGVRVRAAAA